MRSCMSRTLGNHQFAPLLRERPGHLKGATCGDLETPDAPPAIVLPSRDPIPPQPVTMAVFRIVDSATRPMGLMPVASREQQRFPLQDAITELLGCDQRSACSPEIAVVKPLVDHDDTVSYESDPPVRPPAAWVSETGDVLELVCHLPPCRTMRSRHSFASRLASLDERMSPIMKCFFFCRPSCIQDATHAV